jgi:hypothetical protein
MKGSTSFIHIILALLIAFIMLILMSGMAFGIVWFLKTYMGDDLDPSNNIITECIGKCQEGQICSVGTSSNYRLVNGECQCSCIKIKNSNATVNTNAQNLGWQTYDDSNFSVQYPAGWEARTDIEISELANSTVTFSSAEILGDNMWSVLSYDANLVTMDSLIGDMGDEYNDRKETRERITVAGEQATKVTVTTDLIAGWEHVQIFIEKGDTLYAINDGAGRNKDFEKFYKSLQIIK